MVEVCSIDACEGRVLARGWCSKHYQRWRNHGSPLWVPAQAQKRSVAERLADGMKECRRCDRDLPLAEFYRSMANGDGCSQYCKKCSNARQKEWVVGNADRRRAWNRQRSQRRDREQINEAARAYRTTEAGKRATLHQRLRQDHGISLAQYEAMLAQQGGVCVICKLPPQGGNHADQRLHVDHDHATGRIRGLLCRPCNVGLGSFGDDVLRMATAVAYLNSAAAR